MVLSSYFPTSGQTFVFDYPSIIFMVVILITVIGAAKKGFVAALIGMICSIGAYILASLFCKSLGATLFNTGLGEKVYTPLFEWISRQGELFNTPINKETAPTVIAQGLTQLGIPEFLAPTLTSLVEQLGIIPETGEIVLSVAIAQTLSSYAFIAGAWVIITLGVQIICGIILLCLKKVIKHLKLAFVDHSLGALIGLVSGVFTCLVIAYVLVLGLTCTSFLEFVKPLIAWDDPNSYTITKAFCNAASDIVSIFLK